MVDPCSVEPVGLVLAGADRYATGSCAHGGPPPGRAFPSPPGEHGYSRGG